MGVRRTISAALVGALTAGILTVTAGGAFALTSEESQFVSKINAERKARGKRALVVKSDLVSVARRHSAKMAKEGRIWHNENLANEVDGNWTLLGENVGMGPSVDSLHKAFMNSDGHRRNILDGQFNQIGVGVVIDDGVIYTTHVFAKRGTVTKTTTTTTKRTTSKTTAPAPSKPRVTAQAPAPKPVTPKPKPKPAPEPEPRTVDLLVRMLGMDAETVDPGTGTAAAF